MTSRNFQDRPRRKLQVAHGLGKQRNIVRRRLKETITYFERKPRSKCLYRERWLTEELVHFLCPNGSPHDRSSTAKVCGNRGNRDLRIAIANGMFGGSNGQWRNCKSRCVYNLESPKGVAWEYYKRKKCWMRAQKKSKCFNSREHQFALRRAKELCWGL